LLVVDLLDFDADPASYPDVGRAEVRPGLVVDQRLLNAWGGSDPDRDVAVAMVVVGEHGENAFRSEECRHAMRLLFDRVRKRLADAPNACELFALVQFGRRRLCDGGRFAVIDKVPGFTEPVSQRRFNVVAMCDPNEVMELRFR
jgi:hypothetical protein